MVVPGSFGTVGNSKRAQAGGCQLLLFLNLFLELLVVLKIQDTLTVLYYLIRYRRSTVALNKRGKDENSSFLNLIRVQNMLAYSVCSCTSHVLVIVMTTHSLFITHSLTQAHSLQTLILLLLGCNDLGSIDRTNRQLHSKEFTSVID